MPQDQLALLPDRAVIRLSGAEVRGFLQGLITTDVDRLDRDGALYGGLLTPQGKILFDFFMATDGESVLIDCARNRAAELVKRLTFYRLRAAVEIADLSETHAVAALWRDDGSAPDKPDGVTGFVDPRLAAMGLRLIGETAAVEAVAANAADVADYHRLRIGHGLADSSEIGSGEHFPHECNFDQIGGVDFSKGCFVGQEVVSRTEHRGTARKRILPVSVAGNLASGSDVVAGGKPVGQVLAANDGHGLAIIRLDRVESAVEAGEAIETDGGALTLVKPAWARFAVPGA
jgi:folate-binding protein YgfZ